MGLFDFLKKKGAAGPAIDAEAQRRAEEKARDEERERRWIEAREREARAEAEFAATLEAIPSVEIAISEKAAPKRSVGEADELPFSTVTIKTPRDKLGNFVVIDTETTGLYPSQAEIVEISAIRFRGFKPVEKFTTLCKPKKGISEEARRINHISEEMVADKPEFGKVADALVAFIGKDNLVGHNLDFDLRFIVKHGADVASVKRKYYDTLYLAQKTLKQEKKKWDKELHCYMPDYEADYDVEDYKLATLCEHYKIPFYGSHRALADCYVTGLLLEKLAQDRE